jgi:hypothetical protein
MIPTVIKSLDKKLDKLEIKSNILRQQKRLTAITFRELSDGAKAVTNVSKLLKCPDPVCISIASTLLLCNSSATIFKSLT